jgi:hypothetical protein
VVLGESSTRTVAVLVEARRHLDETGGFAACLEDHPSTSLRRAPFRHLARTFGIRAARDGPRSVVVADERFEPE